MNYFKKGVPAVTGATFLTETGLGDTVLSTILSAWGFTRGVVHGKLKIRREVPAAVLVIGDHEIRARGHDSRLRSFQEESPRQKFGQFLLTAELPLASLKVYSA